MFCDGVRDAIQRERAMAVLVCENVAATMERHAKDNAPWKDRTAHARQSINGRCTANGNIITMTIAHGVRYGQYLEMGTPPHIITVRPKNKKALFWPGATHPVKLARVPHPGSRPYPAVAPAAEEGARKLRQALSELWGG